MCGIVGLAGWRDDALVREMMARVAHRGPDGEGALLGDAVSLGTRRLAIIDLEGSHQPVFGEDRSLAVVYNGEIYNYRELRGLLEKRGHRLATAGDTEVLVHLHEEYGDAGVHLLRGMFAYALLDVPRGRLLLVRDRLGIKPLYYATHGGRLAFASEVQALLAVPWVDRSLDDEALDLYLALQYVPGTQTLLRGVRRLPPGHLLAWRDGRPEVRRYWDVVLDDAGRSLDAAAAAEEYRERLDEAVRLHQVSDVPVGVLLSGGIDSATITALMARAGQRVRTFTVGFDVAGEEGELAQARRLAARFGTEHQEVVLGPGLADALPAMVAAQDEPVADAAAIPTHAVCRLAARSVKVVLTGEGSDELLGGYPRYRWLRLGERLRPLGARLGHAAALDRLARRARADGALRRAGVLLGEASLAERHLAWVAAMDGALQAALRPGRDGRAACRAALEGVLEASGSADPVHRLMYLDLETWLVDDVLAKTDRMSMASSVEARVPFLDHPLVEFLAGLPARVKVRSLGTKALLRHAMRDVLPTETLARRKRAFLVPVGAWLSGHLAGLAGDCLGAPSARVRALLDPAAVDALLSGARAGGAPHARALWTVLVLELWLRTVRDAPAAAHR